MKNRYFERRMNHCNGVAMVNDKGGYYLGIDGKWHRDDDYVRQEVFAPNLEWMECTEAETKKSIMDFMNYEYSIEYLEDIVHDLKLGGEKTKKSLEEYEQKLEEARRNGEKSFSEADVERMFYNY